jgi:hypothetical protein
MMDHSARRKTALVTFEMTPRFVERATPAGAL